MVCTSVQNRCYAIDLALNNAVDNKDGVKLERHLGFAWWLSVTSGFHCVDIRKFFIPRGEERQKPTRTGVTLAPREWTSLKELMPVIHGHYLPLSIALPCYHYPAHNGLDCLECNGVWDLQTRYRYLKWTRKVPNIGQWMREAMDRHRFRSRIHETETIIEPILANTHRDRIRSLLCYMCVYE